MTNGPAWLAGTHGAKRAAPMERFLAAFLAAFLATDFFGLFGDFALRFAAAVFFELFLFAGIPTVFFFTALLWGPFFAMVIAFLDATSPPEMRDSD